MISYYSIKIIIIYLSTKNYFYLVNFIKFNYFIQFIIIIIMTNYFYFKHLRLNAKQLLQYY